MFRGGREEDEESSSGQSRKENARMEGVLFLRPESEETILMAFLFR